MIMRIFNKIFSMKVLLFFMTGFLLVSCKSYYIPLTIEDPNPTKDELPKDVQSLTLMNRSMDNQFKNYQEDSLQSFFYKNGYQLSKIVLDSIAADTTIKALAALIFESGRYDVVVPVERNIKRILPSEFLPDTLRPDQVSKICTDYNTDALMVMDRFSTKLMADNSKEKYVDQNRNAFYSYNASLDLKYDAFFRIYKPGKKTLIKEIELIDTISWESTDNNQTRMFNKIPSIKMAMIDAGIKVALDIDSKLSPTWTQEKRGYFLFKPGNDRGQQLMNDSNYEEAGKYWEEMAQSKNKNIRSKAEYNLALVKELNGDIDGAIEWGLKSFYSYYRYQTEAYLKKLQARKETILKSK
jgi:hypothetical protein